MIGKASLYIENKKFEARVRKRLDELDEKLGDITYFAYQNDVKIPFKKALHKNINDFRAEYEATGNLDVVIYQTIGNICYDLISSGRNHSYLGTLDDKGKQLMRIFNTALVKVVELNAMSQEEAIDIKQKLEEDIKLVG